MCCNCNNRNTRCKPHSFVDVTCSKSISWEDAVVLLGLSHCNDIVPVEKPDVAADETLSYRGDLSGTGSTLTISLDDLRIVATRQNTTTVAITATSSVNTTLYVTRVATGASAPDAWRKTITLAPSGDIDSVTVGSYIIVEYYVTYNNTKYHIVAGSDNDTLSVAWVEITKQFNL